MSNTEHQEADTASPRSVVGELQSDFDECGNSADAKGDDNDSEVALLKKQLAEYSETNAALTAKLESTEVALQDANKQLEQESALRSRAEQEHEETRAKLQEMEQAPKADGDGSNTNQRTQSFRELFTEKKLAEAAEENSILLSKLEDMKTQAATLETETEETRSKLEEERTLRQEAEQKVKQIQSAGNVEMTQINGRSPCSKDENMTAKEVNELEATRIKLELAESEQKDSTAKFQEAEKALSLMRDAYEKSQQLLVLRESELEEKRLESELQQLPPGDEGVMSLKREVKALEEALSAREEELKVKSFQLGQAGEEQRKMLVKCLEVEEDMVSTREDFRKLEEIVSLREKELEEEKLNLKRAKDDTGGYAFVSLKEEYKELREVLNSREIELREKHIKLEEANQKQLESEEQLRDAEEAFYILEEDHTKAQELLSLRESELEEARLELELERAHLEETRLELKLQQKIPNEGGIDIKETGSTSTLSKLTETADMTEENASDDDEGESDKTLAIENGTTDITTSDEFSPSEFSLSEFSHSEISSHESSSIKDIEYHEISSDESSSADGPQYEELVDQDGFPVTQKVKSKRVTAKKNRSLKNTVRNQEGREILKLLQKQVEELKRQNHLQESRSTKLQDQVKKLQGNKSQKKTAVDVKSSLAEKLRMKERKTTIRRNQKVKDMKRKEIPQENKLSKINTFRPITYKEVEVEKKKKKSHDKDRGQWESYAFDQVI